MDYSSTAYEEAKPLLHDLSKEKISASHGQKRIPDSEVLTRASLFSIWTILMPLQLRWAKLLYREMSLSKCSHEDQKKHFKDTLKDSMKSFGITSNSLEYLAQNRDKWREIVKRGAKACEARRNAATEQRRKLRKSTATSVSPATIPCSHCPRLFRTQIDLISHLRANGPRPRSQVY